MAIKVDTSKFERALKEALLHTHRDLPAVLNGHAIGVITKAAALTPKADKATIPYKLYAEVANSKNNPTPILYMILNARQKKAGKKALNNDAMRAAAKKLIDKRVASIGFNAYAGWQNALIAVGGHGFGSKGKRKGFEKSSAARGQGRPATVGSLRSIFSNTAEWIEHIGAGPLRQALHAEEMNMLRHIESKLSQRCKEASR